MLTLLTPRVWKEITGAAVQCKSPARVAVAYFGRKGDALLPLSAGSSLVTDASIPTLSAGATCPFALERLRKKGVEIYSAQDLHAKVYAFEKVAFIGSANASQRSEKVLIEAVLCTSNAALVSSARSFVKSLCLTKLSGLDLAELTKYYKPPKFPAAPLSQAKYVTLVMELTNEQGAGRETQVQPPKAVWETFFGIKVGIDKLPVLTLTHESAGSTTTLKRPVIKHDHNYTVEMSGAEPPRPAILQMRRAGHNKYVYCIHRSADTSFASISAYLQTLHNPLRQSGRLWVLI